MSETVKAPPDWLPADVVTDLKARFAGERLIPVKTDLGPVVLHAPSREAVLARYPAEHSGSGARGLELNDGDLDKDTALVADAVIYPDKAALQQILAKRPMLIPFLAGRARLAATGYRGELKGVPEDLAELGLDKIEATSVNVYQVLVDTEPSRLVLRSPSTDALRQWEASRQKRSGVVAAEHLTYSCLLYPKAEVVQELFTRRPLLGIYCANRLFAWGLGDIEEAEGEL